MIHTQTHTHTIISFHLIMSEYELRNINVRNSHIYRHFRECVVGTKSRLHRFAAALCCATFRRLRFGFTLFEESEGMSGCVHSGSTLHRALRALCVTVALVCLLPRRAPAPRVCAPAAAGLRGFPCTRKGAVLGNMPIIMSITLSSSSMSAAKDRDMRGWRMELVENGPKGFAALNISNASSSS